MNFNALERLARRALALQPSHSLATAHTAQCALTTTEDSALRSPRWQTAAPLGRDRDEDASPRDVVADNPDMGGWF